MVHPGYLDEGFWFLEMLGTIKSKFIALIGA